MNGALCYSFRLFTNLKPLQVGDVAILDISATTIEQDESAVQRIPSAESKGLRQNTLVNCDL